MTTIYLDYQISSKQIAKEFVKLSFIIPMSFALVGTIISHYGKTIHPSVIYVVAAMAVAVFLLLQGIAWWYFRNPNTYSFRVTDTSVEYKTKDESYKLGLSSIQWIETSRTHGGETSTIDYFFVTDSGESFKIPKIHNLPDEKIVKAIMTANPAIIKR